MPIVVQPDYIRKALKAGKHVLSEKPIAKDLVTARELLDWYHDLDVGENDGGADSRGHKSGGTWSVAENFRFIESFIYAAKRIGEMERVLGFSVRMATFVRPGDRYFGMRPYPFPLSTPSNSLSLQMFFVSRQSQSIEWGIETDDIFVSQKHHGAKPPPTKADSSSTAASTSPPASASFSLLRPRGEESISKISPPTRDNHNHIYRQRTLLTRP